MKTIKLLSIFLFSILFTQCTTLKNAKSAQKNKETLVLWFYEGWNKNKGEELIPLCFTKDWTDGNPLRATQADGHEGMHELYKSYRKAFPDIQFKITHIIADERKVAVRYEISATHEGKILGVAPTNSKIYSTGIAIYEMENGRIKTTWQEVDLMGILNQIKN